jgi:hypothetical protein
MLIVFTAVDSRGSQRVAVVVTVCLPVLLKSGISMVTHRTGRPLAVALLWLAITVTATAELVTWDGRHSIESIEVSVVYFVPPDRTPLPDWHDRVSYFCRRIEQFHAREFQGQSTLKTMIHPQPFRSASTTDQLRVGDGNAIFFRTLREVDEDLKFAQDRTEAFPILLVLSDINWRPLDDFYRLRPREGKLEFEGNYNDGRHYPGAQSGGARATYLSHRGVGWGLVSADGWRVPYSGSDCVVYHEGVGHTVGLPHPEPGNGSVMSLGQYHGWISQSWLDDEQKLRLGWTREKSVERTDLFSVFQAIPEPRVPQPDQATALALEWPADAQLKSLRVRIQTDLLGPWLDIPVTLSDSEPGGPPAQLSLGQFDRPTPVSYRVDAELQDGQQAELWGYFQVRQGRNQAVVPETIAQPELIQVLAPNAASPPAARPTAASAAAVDTEQPLRRSEEVDLLNLLDPQRDAVSGKWSLTEQRLESPKAFGARIEIPYQPSAEYQLHAIVEPLDEPNGLLLGQRSGEHRFAVLVNYALGDGEPASALEDIDGLNVLRNDTTLRARLLQKNKLSQIVCTVRQQSVVVLCDGVEIIRWQGDAVRLSLSDYWNTPQETALFVGAYDCRYRIHQLTLIPISGDGKPLRGI